MSDREGDEVGKIFVGGLTRETDDDMLRNYFSQYGEIIESESIVMRDKMTNYSRGFGFVKYKDPSCVAEVLKNRPHTLDNKKIDPKPCTPKSIQQQKKNAAMEHTQTHKIFVGGIAQNTTEDDVKQYFQQYGTVTEVIFVLNNEENRHKGFGFVTFEDEAAFNQAVDKHFHEICGKRVEARKAVPREKQAQGGRGGMGRQDGSEGYEGMYAYGYSNQGQGFMPPQGNGMMNEYGYGAGYGTSYPQGYGMGQQSYYGYNYNPAMGGYGGMGQVGKTDNGGGPYGGMGGNYQQQSSGYGPTRGGPAQPYGGAAPAGGADYGNGYGRSGGDSGGKAAGQGYHPYKR